MLGGGWTLFISLPQGKSFSNISSNSPLPQFSRSNAENKNARNEEEEVTAGRSSEPDDGTGDRAKKKSLCDMEALPASRPVQAVLLQGCPVLPCFPIFPPFLFFPPFLKMVQNSEHEKLYP